MKAAKMSVSLDPGLRDEIKKAAAKADLSVSAWLAEAARAELRKSSLAEFIAGWEREGGAITEEELREAEARLGLPGGPPTR